ncbi:hypothetical protein DL96DRAFT_1714607 [Flagelloscypha sp. PMI_526]|nr:hypothetical protein DL96DRAFT_1714607 [Flagelloscypha sp. PMI_526]
MKANPTRRLVAVWLRFSRVWIIYSEGLLRWTIAPALPLGLVCPILGLTISTPSIFPNCRRWEDDQVSRSAHHLAQWTSSLLWCKILSAAVALAQPRLRAAFGAVALVIMLALFRHHVFDVQSPSHFGTAKRIIRHLTPMVRICLLSVNLVNRTTMLPSYSGPDDEIKYIGNYSAAFFKAVINFVLVENVPHYEYLVEYTVILPPPTI